MVVELFPETDQEVHRRSSQPDTRRRWILNELREDAHLTIEQCWTMFRARYIASYSAFMADWLTARDWRYAEIRTDRERMDLVEETFNQINDAISSAAADGSWVAMMRALMARLEQFGDGGRSEAMMESDRMLDRIWKRTEQEAS